MKLFLDDVREPREIFPDVDIEWTVVRNYAEFTESIIKHYDKTNQLPAFVSFDHDLAIEHYTSLGGEVWTGSDQQYKGLRERTGYDCAKWLVMFCGENDLRFPAWHVHSFNPVGAENIKRLITAFTTSRTKR